jgi:hypothetical protein
MTGIEERIARNNFTFREANERIRAKADEYGAPLEQIPFLCECPDPGCTTIVRLTTDEYAAIRANTRHFFTVAGHEQAEKPLGEVVSREDGYVIVEKEL